MVKVTATVNSFGVIREINLEFPNMVYDAYLKRMRPVTIDLDIIEKLTKYGEIISRKIVWEK
jgi:hypothetical protein